MEFFIQYLGEDCNELTYKDFYRLLKNTSCCYMIMNDLGERSFYSKELFTLLKK